MAKNLMETLLTKLLVPLVAVLGVSALCIFMLLVDYLRNRSQGDDVDVPSRTPSWARPSSIVDDDGPHDTLVIDRKAMRDTYHGSMPMDTRAVTDLDAPRRSPEPPPPAAPPPRPTDSLRLADLRRQQEAQRPADPQRSPEPVNPRDTPRPAPRPDPMRRSGEFSRQEAYRSPEPPRNAPPPQRPGDSGRQDRPVPPRPPSHDTSRTGMPTRASLDPRDPRRSGEFTRSSLSGDGTTSGAFRRPPTPPPLQSVGSNIVLNQPLSQAGYVQLPGKIDIIYGNFSPTDPREIPFLWQAADNTPPRYTFSKSPGEGVSHIQLNHYTITSGTQAELRFLDGRPVLVNLIEPEDMERYQTRVNGIPLGPGESNSLSSGDIISMGIYRLKLSL